MGSTATESNITVMRKATGPASKEIRKTKRKPIGEEEIDEAVIKLRGLYCLLLGMSQASEDGNPLYPVETYSTLGQMVDAALEDLGEPI